MGWKNVKEHYRIEHIVCVTEEGICIGSAYVHNLITIDPNLSIKRLEHLGRGQPFDGWVEAMMAEPDTLRRLIETPDTFVRDLTVYTYRMGDIIEKQCEETGWPNITHDGCLMYENLFSTDRDEVARWAENNAACGAKSIRTTISNVDRDQRERRQILASYEAAVAQLAVKRTPEEWLETTLYQNIEVLDPDGWDRSDFERSWAEPITRGEFERRLMLSTCKFPPWFGGVALSDGAPGREAGQ